MSQEELPPQHWPWRLWRFCSPVIPSYITLWGQIGKMDSRGLGWSKIRQTDIMQHISYINHWLTIEVIWTPPIFGRQIHVVVCSQCPLQAGFSQVGPHAAATSALAFAERLFSQDIAHSDAEPGLGSHNTGTGRCNGTVLIVCMQAPKTRKLKVCETPLMCQDDKLLGHRLEICDWKWRHSCVTLVSFKKIQQASAYWLDMEVRWKLYVFNNIVTVYDSSLESVKEWHCI